MVTEFIHENLLLSIKSRLVSVTVNAVVNVLNNQKNVEELLHHSTDKSSEIANF